MSTATTTTTIGTSTNGYHSSDQDVAHTKLNFYLDPSLGGQTSFAIGTAGAYRRKFDERPIDINDARGHEADFNLDTHGFQHYRRPCTEKDFTDDDQIKAVAYPEVQQLLKDVTGATNVYVFSHITRRNNPKAIQTALNDPSNAADDKPVSGIFPASYIHIDQTPACAVQVLQDHFDTSSALGRHALSNNGRWGIINVWRPISRVRRDPLALCDARSIRDDDLVPIKILQPPKTAKTQYATTTKGEYMEIFYAKYTEGQRWWFVSGMDTDEVLLIKCYDSSTKQGLAKRCPHSAFDWVENESDRETTRESIEIRCLVFWEDQTN